MSVTTTHTWDCVYVVNAGNEENKEKGNYDRDSEKCLRKLKDRVELSEQNNCLNKGSDQDVVIHSDIVLCLQRKQSESVQSHI